LTELLPGAWQALTLSATAAVSSCDGTAALRRARRPARAAAAAPTCTVPLRTPRRPGLRRGARLDGEPRLARVHQVGDRHAQAGRSAQRAQRVAVPGRAVAEAEALAHHHAGHLGAADTLQGLWQGGGAEDRRSKRGTLHTTSHRPAAQARQPCRRVQASQVEGLCMSVMTWRCASRTCLQATARPAQCMRRMVAKGVTMRRGRRPPRAHVQTVSKEARAGA